MVEESKAIKELANLAERAGRHLTTRQLEDAMKHMDVDGSGKVEFDEFVDWWVPMH